MWPSLNSSTQFICVPGISFLTAFIKLLWGQKIDPWYYRAENEAQSKPYSRK